MRSLPPALLARPWRSHAPDLGAAPPTMLMLQEQNLLHWLAAHYYCGAGLIVDAGCFLGGSTHALAIGLASNPRADAAAALIHSYDLFTTPQSLWFDELTKFGVEPAQPFLDRFRQHLAPHLHRIHVHAGDLLDQSWHGQPVEILFLDICKSPAVHDHATRLWFPRLIPGRSIVIQQDYGWWSYYWGNVMMEAFADHFAVLDDVPVASRVYLCTKEIRQDQADELVYSRLTADDKLRHMAAAVESARQSPFRGHVLLNHALLADELGQTDLVEQLLMRLMYTERCEQTAPVAVRQLPRYFTGPDNLTLPEQINNRRLSLISQMSGHERLCLYALVLGLRPQRVLEIGRARGGSTLVMAAALAHIAGSRLVSLDPNCHPEHSLSPALAAKLPSHVTLIDGRSPHDNPTACAAAKGKFDLVLIDGNHHYEACLADLSGVLPFLNDNAVILLHDAHFLGVKEAVRTVLEAERELVDCGLVSTQANYDLAEKMYLGQPSVYGGLQMLRFQAQRRSRFWRLDFGRRVTAKPKLPFLSRVKREVNRVLGRHPRPRS